MFDGVVWWKSALVPALSKLVDSKIVRVVEGAVHTHRNGDEAEFQVTGPSGGRFHSEPILAHSEF